MAEENRLRFVEAVRELDGPAILQVLPSLTISDLDVVRDYWLRGKLGELDPTNVLSAGDYADQFLSLPEHAVALYDAALEYLNKHPQSIAGDTDCAAASLNLIDLLIKSGQEHRAAEAARRASRMPVMRAEQHVQLAFCLAQIGDAKSAYTLFQRGKSVGLDNVAAAMGVPVADLAQMERVLSKAAGTA